MAEQDKNPLFGHTGNETEKYIDIMINEPYKQKWIILNFGRLSQNLYLSLRKTNE